MPISYLPNYLPYSNLTVQNAAKRKLKTAMETVVFLPGPSPIPDLSRKTCHLDQDRQLKENNISVVVNVKNSAQIPLTSEILKAKVIKLGNKNSQSSPNFVK